MKSIDILGIKIKYVNNIWYMYKTGNYDMFLCKPDLTMILNFINKRTNTN